MPSKSVITQIRVENIVTCLNAAVELVSKGLKTPFLESIVNTVCSLLAAAQTIKKNKDECVEILEQIHQLLCAIIQVHITSNTAGDLSPKVNRVHLLGDMAAIEESAHQMGSVFLNSSHSISLLPPKPKIFRRREAELSAIVNLFRTEAPRIAISGGMGKTNTRTITGSSLPCDTVSTSVRLAGLIGAHKGPKSGNDPTRPVKHHFLYPSPGGERPHSAKPRSPIVPGEAAVGIPVPNHRERIPLRVLARRTKYFAYHDESEKLVTSAKLCEPPAIRGDVSFVREKFWNHHVLNFRRRLHPQTSQCLYLGSEPAGASRLGEAGTAGSETGIPRTACLKPSQGKLELECISLPAAKQARRWFDSATGHMRYIHVIRTHRYLWAHLHLNESRFPVLARAVRYSTLYAKPRANVLTISQRTYISTCGGVSLFPVRFRIVTSTATVTLNIRIFRSISD
ncbi:hypothetical protein GGX14DRAFT_609480 [Mycena pura]|uniref:Uncharacterized protein n=1 Tax=Mycena pura TaxID=153505 RepID=A0AAD6VJB1_9AGAR|nr:hypothetical protein GGX14DRAFT_609480 [Mycena pura]